MLGKGDGTFRAPVRVGTGFPKESTAAWMGVADLNGDGKADVVIVNGDERTVRVFLNTTPSPAPPPVGGGPGPGPGGGPGGGPPPILTAPPEITRFTQSSKRWTLGTGAVRVSRRSRLPVGTTFRLTLDTPARVRLVFLRCQARCRHTAGRLAFAGHAGLNRVRFSGRISRHRHLRPGRYRLLATPVDAAGELGAVRSLSFEIVRR
jgi:hypothetical protein